MLNFASLKFKSINIAKSNKFKLKEEKWPADELRKFLHVNDKGN